jgi:hypothetical protein
MKTGLGLAVFGVFQHQKRLIKENFFRFRLVYAVFLRILAGVTFVPVKARALCFSQGRLKPKVINKRDKVAIQEQQG